MKYVFDYIWFNLSSTYTWKESLKWLATLIVVAAAMIITFFPNAGLHIQPFIMFLIGHVIWSIFAVVMKEWSLFFLNSCFIIIDVIGVIIRL